MDGLAWTARAARSLRRAQRCPEALDLGGKRADGGRLEFGLAIGLLGLEAGRRNPGREGLHGLGRALLGLRGVRRRRGECLSRRRVNARRFVGLRPSLGQCGIEEIQPATRRFDGLLHGARRAQRLGHLEFQFLDARGLGGLAPLQRLHLIGGGLQ